MPARDQLVVFAYDISKNGLRSRISAVLERFGTRVQYSIFECRMPVEKATKLHERLGLMRDPGDSIRMYVIPEDGRRLSRASGGAPVAEKSEFWLL
jgi:CRISPR-associated protein Cas2